MKRAKIGATAGEVADLFRPFHANLDCPDIGEVNDTNIMKLIMINSGTYQHTIGDAQHKPIEQKSQPAPVKTSSAQQINKSPAPQGQHVTLTSGGRDTTKINTSTRGMGGEKQVASSTHVEGVIVLEGEDAILDGIKSVHSDNSGVNWCLVTYTAPKTNHIKFHASGSGGLDELRQHLKDTVIMYGIIRKVEKIDDTEAVKFCFIDWRGENINRMQRASLGVHSGAITALFRPYHVDVQCADASELSDDIIMKKIKFASGTAVHTK